MASGRGRTLKPMMIACDADASMTSDSLIAPTPVWMTRSRTSVCSTFLSASTRAPTEPCTSPLMMMLSSLSPPSLDAREEVVERDRPAVGQLLRPQALAALGGALARLALVLDHPEALAGVHDAAEAEHLDRHRRAGPGDRGLPV